MVVEFLDEFYDECAEGDLGPRRHRQQVHGRRGARHLQLPLHPRGPRAQAVLAALDIQARWSKHAPGPRRRRWGSASASIPARPRSARWAGVQDFTIIGPVVNLASRIQGAAKSGEMLVSDQVYARLAGRIPRPGERDVQLKGIDAPVQLHPIHLR